MTTTTMKCPICGDTVDDHNNDDGCLDQDSELFINECFGSMTQTYDPNPVHIYKCHSDHTFFMHPTEMTIWPTC